MKNRIYDKLWLVIRIITIKIQIILLWLSGRRRVDLRISYFNELDASYSSVCFYVVYSKNIDSSRRRFLQSLKAINSYVIVILNNDELDAGKPDLELIDCIIYNKNVGMDIGGHKRASQYFYDSVETAKIPDKIIYANDSLFFIGESKDCFDALINRESKWVGMFENSGLGQYHVSSWLFSVSKDLFLSSDFKKYWVNYKPINNKYHAIHAGEHGITKALLKLGVVPKIVYSNKLIDELLVKHLRNDFFTEYTYLSTEFTNYINSTGINTSTALDLELMIYKIRDSFYLVSPMHLIQLLFLKHTNYSFIKKDLFWNERLSYAKITFLDYLLDSKISADERAEILNYYLTRGRLRDA
ncbi:MAG TPA: rhamnan synthesis F family protein, partial [Halothiobacillus sp.]|nr:rhamnan synthesis F family protein [Halothiobacillus sp.]